MYIFFTQWEIFMPKGCTHPEYSPPSILMWERQQTIQPSSCLQHTCISPSECTVYRCLIANRESWKESLTSCTGYIHGGECVIHARTLHEKCYFCSSPPPPWVKHWRGRTVSYRRDGAVKLTTQSMFQFWLLKHCHRWCHSQMHIVSNDLLDHLSTFKGFQH